jgi:hypothetical protein
MRYRKTENVVLPFSVTPMVRDLSSNKLEIGINSTKNYEMRLPAIPLILKVPMPNTTASANWKRHPEGALQSVLRIQSFGGLRTLRDDQEPILQFE